MSGSVYKIVELVGSSSTSWEDAAKNAVETAAESRNAPALSVHWCSRHLIGKMGMRPS